MPLYFLHIREGGDFIPDPEGIERSDLADVEKATIESANALIADAVKRGRRDYHGRFEVADERGATVLTLSFACTVQIEVYSRL